MSLTVKDASRVTQTINTDATASPGEHTPRHVPIPVTSGGFTIYRNIDANATGVNIKASAGQLYGWYLYNQSASIRFVKFYNKASAPTVGTDTPVLTIPIPAGGGCNVLNTIGIAFSLGIGIGATTGIADANTSAPTANDVICNVFYK